MPKQKYQNYLLNKEIEKEGHDHSSVPQDHNTPDVLIYSNSKFKQIKEWLIDWVKHNRAESRLRIDLALTPYKYFNGLKHNISRMFPHHNL